MTDYYYKKDDTLSERALKMLIGLDLAIHVLANNTPALAAKLALAAEDIKSRQTDPTPGTIAIVDEMVDFIIINAETAYGAKYRASARDQKLTALRRYCKARGMTFKDAGRNDANEKTYNVTLRATQRSTGVTLRGDVSLNQAYADMLEGTLIRR